MPFIICVTMSWCLARDIPRPGHFMHNEVCSAAVTIGSTARVYSHYPRSDPVPEPAAWVCARLAVGCASGICASHSPVLIRLQQRRARHEAEDACDDYHLHCGTAWNCLPHAEIQDLPRAEQRTLMYLCMPATQYIKAQATKYGENIADRGSIRCMTRNSFRCTSGLTWATFCR